MVNIVTIVIIIWPHDIGFKLTGWTWPSTSSDAWVFAFWSPGETLNAVQVFGDDDDDDDNDDDYDDENNDDDNDDHDDDDGRQLWQRVRHLFHSSNSLPTITNRGKYTVYVSYLRNHHFSSLTSIDSQDHDLKEGSTLTSLAPRVFATLRTAYGLGR